MKQTPVQWLYDQIGENAPYEYAAQIASYLEEAMKMEAEIPELSDEEIDEMVSKVSTKYMHQYYIDGIGEGARLYREQLKQRQ